MSEDVKLEPCPFCGGETVSGTGYTDYGDFGWVECTNCPAIMSSDMGTEAEAITKWNTRHDPQAAYERGKADGLEEARLNLARRIKEQSQEIATQERAQERGRIVAGVNNLITEYIKSPGIGFSDTMTAKMALEDAIKVINQTE